MGSEPTVASSVVRALCGDDWITVGIRSVAIAISRRTTAA